MDSLFLDFKKKKAKGAHEPKAQTNGAYPGFHEVCLEVSQGYTWVKRDQVKWSSLSKESTWRAWLKPPDLQIRSSRC